MIQQFADWLVYNLIGVDATTHLGEALNFFVYDTLKIVLLLFLISVVMGVVNAYFPVERVRNFLTSRRLYGLQYLLASLFGAITPFCSCSSIPLFIGFVKGASVGRNLRIPHYISFSQRGCRGDACRHIRLASDRHLCHKRHSLRHHRRLHLRKNAT